MYAALYAQTSCHDVDDWFLPSKDELDLVFNNLIESRPCRQTNWDHSARFEFDEFAPLVSDMTLVT